MKVAFDLDGTLDRPAVASLAKELIAAGVEVHIITGTFEEGGPWQDTQEKKAKVRRLGLEAARLHVIMAKPEAYPREYRLADIGLRKGALCLELGIDILIDDSAVYCEMAPKMYGGLTVMKVG